MLVWRPFHSRPVHQYEELIAGVCECVDRIVINADLPGCGNGGRFRNWWRSLLGSDYKLDDEHLMRMAGRFSRRLRGWAKANGVSVVDCDRGERKHLAAEEFLATHKVERGLFLVLVGRAPEPVWDVKKTTQCESLLLPHHGPGLGTLNGADVRPSPVQHPSDFKWP